MHCWRACCPTVPHSNGDKRAIITPASAPLFMQLSNMELTKQQANVMAALKQGNDALKKAQQEVRQDRAAASETCRKMLLGIIMADFVLIDQREGWGKENG